MAATVPNAREWSETVTARDFRPGDLDYYVLKQYDAILRALGRESTLRQREPRAASAPRDGAMVVVVIAAMASVAGLFTLGGSGRAAGSGAIINSDGFDAGLGVPVAVTCFLLALAGPPLVLHRWWHSNRRWRIGESVALAGTAVCAALTLAGMDRSWEVDALAFAPASLPMWAALVLAAVALGAMAGASNGRRDAVAKHFRVVGVADPHRARELIEGLHEGERTTLFTQRARAIATLRERGLVDLSEAAHVESLPLGASPTIDT